MNTENPIKRNRIAVESAKDHLRNVFKVHGLRIVEYKKVEPLSYEMEITKLGRNILTYIVSSSPDKKVESNAQEFCRSCSFDWENILK